MNKREKNCVSSLVCLLTVVRTKRKPRDREREKGRSGNEIGRKHFRPTRRDHSPTGRKDPKKRKTESPGKVPTGPAGGIPTHASGGKGGRRQDEDRAPKSEDEGKVMTRGGAKTDQRTGSKISPVRGPGDLQHPVEPTL